MTVRLQAFMSDFGLAFERVPRTHKEQDWHEDCCHQPSMTRSLFFKMLLSAAKVSLELKTVQLTPDAAAAFLNEKLVQV